MSDTERQKRARDDEAGWVSQIMSDTEVERQKHWQIKAGYWMMRGSCLRCYGSETAPESELASDPQKEK